MPKYKIITETPTRMFAIGDIHGCVDEVTVLLEHLENKAGLSTDDLVVFIGDYIDRGPDSRGVLDLLLDYQKRYPEMVFLKGNHEDMFLDYLGFGGTMGGAYLHNGGSECLQSYDIGYVESAEQVLEHIPREQLSFLLNLERYVITERFVFAHAGVNPLRDLTSQLDQDLFWVRDEFIENIHHFEKTIVFGHTPYQDILLHMPYKIGIDTGAVYGNALTCVEVLGKKVYQVDRGDREVKETTFSEKASEYHKGEQS